MESDPFDAVARVVTKWANLVQGSAATHNVPPALILALIHQESKGDPDLYGMPTSTTGAGFGLMQLGVGIARELGYYGPVRMLFDGSLNIELGAQYLAGELTKYRDTFLTLLAIYDGPWAVRWYKAGWVFGPAVRYAKTVVALQHYYERLIKSWAPGPVPHLG